MRLSSYVVASLSGALLLAACGNPSSTPNVRSGPQSQHPVTFGPNHVPATAGQALVALPALLDNAGISSEEFGETLFPSAYAKNSLSKPMSLFQSICLSHAPNVDAIAKAAARAGLDVERPSPNQVIAIEWTETSFVSLQVNIESPYAFECATTGTADPSATAQAVREDFFGSLGKTASRGTTVTSFGGSVYNITHQMIDGGALGVNEHAFMLQSPNP